MNNCEVCNAKCKYTISVPRPNWVEMCEMCLDQFLSIYPRPHAWLRERELKPKRPGPFNYSKQKVPQ